MTGTAEAGLVSERRRLDSLTGLRFFAALAVFGLHLVVLFPQAQYHDLDRLVTQGGSGVSFFFILSGFVLTWSHRGGDTASAFIRRRIARIVPSQVVMWAVAGIVLAALAVHTRRSWSLASLLLLSPWVPNVHAAESLNVPAWSLGCEMFFYALFPFALSVLSKRDSRQRRALLVMLVVTVAGLAFALAPAAYPTTRYWAVYFFPPARLPEFLIGMILAIEVAEHRWPRLPVSLMAALAGGSYLADGWVPWPYSTVLVTLVPFVLLIGVIAQRESGGEDGGSVTRILGSPLVVLLGTWSFAFYIVHWPVMVALSSQLPARIGVRGSILLALGSFLVVLAAAALLHYTVEVPFARAIRTGRPRSRPRIGGWTVKGATPAFFGLVAVVALATSAEAVVPTIASKGNTAKAVAAASGSVTPRRHASPTLPPGGTGRPVVSAGTPTTVSGSDRTGPAPVTGQQGSAPAPTGPIAPPSSGSPAHGIGASPTLPAGVIAACAPSQLSITVSTDRASYTVGQQVTISITARNQGNTACDLNVVPCYPEFTVTTPQGTVLWSTTSTVGQSCAPLRAEELLPAQAVSMNAVWSAAYCESVPAGTVCTTTTPTVPAPAGLYVARGEWMSGEADVPEVDFAIT